MRKLRILYWRIRIVFMALKWIPRFNLGDEVIYDGHVWGLSDGVRDPIWKLFRPGASVEVHRDKFRKVRSLSNYWHSFQSGRKFYEGYWLAIWVSNDWRARGVEVEDG